MPGNRHTITTNIILNETVCENLKRDPNLRVMLYCAVPSTMGAYAMLDVAFPGQLEVKLNSDEVKSNYKGLKNKPGTTKPADLTTYIRKQPRYANVLQITYALTTKVKPPNSPADSKPKEVSIEVLYCCFNKRLC
jgi:E3 SUMO-protein ligase PIAS1